MHARMQCCDRLKELPAKTFLQDAGLFSPGRFRKDATKTRSGAARLSLSLSLPLLTSRPPKGWG